MPLATGGFYILLMKAYTAQIIFRIKCGDVSSEQYEEQWRLVYADDERHALQVARQIRLKDATTFIDRHGRTIKWELVAIKYIQPVSLENGSLLISTVKEVEAVAAPVWSEATQD